MSIELLTVHRLEFLSLKRGSTGSSESTHVKISHCWESRVTTLFSVFSDGPYTLFAPTNAAFSLLGDTLIQKLLANPDVLKCECTQNLIVHVYLAGYIDKIFALKLPDFAACKQ